MYYKQYGNTDMMVSYNYNMVAIVNHRPVVLGIMQILDAYIAHQKEVITRRTKFDLDVAEKRVHILEGLKIALDNIDEVVETIKKSRDNLDALNQLVEKFGLTEIQAKAILDMQLRRLTGLERDKIMEELRQILITIEDLKHMMNIPVGLDVIEDKDVNQIIKWAMKEANPLYPTPVTWKKKDFQKLIATIRQK